MIFIIYIYYFIIIIIYIILFIIRLFYYFYSFIIIFFPFFFELIVTPISGDRRGAGTDANVFIQVYGDKGTTKEIPLDNPQNNFERAKTDMFGFESPDLGTMKKLRVWHDNSGNELL